MHTHAAVFRHPDSQGLDIPLRIDVLTIAPKLHHRLLRCIFGILLGAKEVEAYFQHFLAQLCGDIFEF
jgi:hypothetical protein